MFCRRLHVVDDREKNIENFEDIAKLQNQRVSHVHDLSVKECMQELTEKVDEIWEILSIIWLSVKRCKAFESARIDIDICAELPSMDSQLVRHLHLTWIKTHTIPHVS